MRASVIRHPEGEPLILLRQWQREACDGNNCAGFLLSVFEYWYNIKLAASQKARESNDMRETFGEERNQDEGLNMWFKEEELEANLLGEYGRKTIRIALDLLEQKGFIRSGVNPDPRYRMDRRKHFWFCPEAVNGWLAIHRPLIPETTGQFYRNDEVNLPSDHEAFLPRRKGKIAESSGKNTSPRGKNAASYKDTENTPENTPENDDGGQAAKKVTKKYDGPSDPDEIESIDELPGYFKCPQTVRPEIWLTMLRVCRYDLTVKLTKGQNIQLTETASTLSGAGKTEEHLRKFEARWYQSYWGRDGSPPSPQLIRGKWSELMMRKTIESNGKQPTRAERGIHSLAEAQRARRNQTPPNGHGQA